MYFRVILVIGLRDKELMHVQGRVNKHFGPRAKIWNFTILTLMYGASHIKNIILYNSNFITDLISSTSWTQILLLIWSQAPVENRVSDQIWTTCQGLLKLVEVFWGQFLYLSCWCCFWHSLLYTSVIICREHCGVCVGTSWSQVCLYSRWITENQRVFLPGQQEHARQCRIA